MQAVFYTALMLLPITAQTQPVAPQTKPVAPQTQRVAPQTQPVAPQTQPVAPQTQPVAPSFLYEPSYKWDNDLHGTPMAYVPQPGDIMLATDKNWFWSLTHNLAWAGEPHNSAVIVANQQGKLVVLEAGPDDTLWVGVNDMLPHLKHYSEKGPVWIRRRKTPVTPEQSAMLTEFGMRQVGKRFALIRLGAQLTPMRSRGPLRTWWIGGPHGDRDSYFCSELVTETLVAGGLLDRATTRPSATYPHDLFFEKSYNLYLRQHLHLEDNWYPPARWVAAPRN